MTLPVVWTADRLSSSSWPKKAEICMSESEQRAGDVFDLDQLRRLVELMEEKELSEIDLRQLDQRIRLTRDSLGAPVVTTTAPAPVPSAPPTAAQPAADADHVTVTRPHRERVCVRIGQAPGTICSSEQTVGHHKPARVRGSSLPQISRFDTTNRGQYD